MDTPQNAESSQYEKQKQNAEKQKQKYSVAEDDEGMDPKVSVVFFVFVFFLVIFLLYWKLKNDYMFPWKHIWESWNYFNSGMSFCSNTMKICWK